MDENLSVFGSNETKHHTHIYILRIFSALRVFYNFANKDGTIQLSAKVSFSNQQ